MATTEPGLDAWRKRVADDKRAIHSTLIAVCSNDPYKDDPRWTQWTRFGRSACERLDMLADDMLAALAAANDERNRAAEDNERLRGEVERVTRELQGWETDWPRYIRERATKRRVAHRRMGRAAVARLRRAPRRQVRVVITVERLRRLQPGTLVSVPAGELLGLIEARAGICGNRMQATLAQPEICQLRAGHAGWHEGPQWLIDGHAVPKAQWSS